MGFIKEFKHWKWLSILLRVGNVDFHESYSFISVQVVNELGGKRIFPLDEGINGLNHKQNVSLEQNVAALGIYMSRPQNIRS